MAKGWKTGGKAQKPFEYKVTENGCWECISHIGKVVAGGQARTLVYFKGRRWLLHRLVYTQLMGEIPEGLIIRHKCDNSLCCNIEHLETGTHKQNSEDMVERGRNVNGPRKINETAAEEIRDLINSKVLSQKEIGKIYNISPQSVSDIKKHRYWTPENIKRRQAAGKRGSR